MNLDISEFLQIFSPISLHHREPKSYFNPWVFWSESEGCENNSSSAHLPTTPMIHEMIISVLSNITRYWFLLGQFWAPVTIDSRRLLSTSDQPFAFSHLYNNFAMYRLHSEKYKYNIDDANKLHIEPDHIILSGGPATAFLNCRTSIDKPQGFLLELNDKFISVMVTICFPLQSNCIGVLEFTVDHSELNLASFLFDTVEAIKKAGLDVFYVQHLIPYKTINGLEVTKDEIEEALKVVCETHNLALAQVWIPYEDTNNVPFSYSLEDTQTKRLLAIKLTGYLYAVAARDDYDDFEPYFRLGDVMPRAIGEELPLVTLQDYESCYISMLRSDMFIDWNNEYFRPTSALAICLRSNDTGDFNYTFEFLWTKQSNYDILLEAILLTLKRCLPRFKFASGAGIGDELDVHNKDDGTEFKIFQRKRAMVVDDIAHTEGICKTTPKVLPREVIEKQFGKTMKEAAENLNGWDNGLLSPPCALAICLRSNDTGDFSYAFEFIWTQHSNEVIFLENILLTLKRCLLRFKFASGAELGDELYAILVESSTNDEDDEIVESSTDDEDNEIGVFQEKKSSLMPKAPEKGKKPMVVDPIVPSKVKCKTTPTEVTLEDIEKHYGKTQKEAAKILEISESTVKRILRKNGVKNWPAPNSVKRKKANDSSIIQIDANERDNGTIQEPSTININQNELTIKAGLAEFMIKFRIPTSQATFVTVQKEIGMRFNLSPGTYQLEYRDEAKDWILLRSDEEMGYCIESSRKLDPKEVRLRVVPFTQPMSVLVVP